MSMLYVNPTSYKIENSFSLPFFVIQFCISHYSCFTEIKSMKMRAGYVMQRRSNEFLTESPNDFEKRYGRKGCLLTF